MKYTSKGYAPLNESKKAKNIQVVFLSLPRVVFLNVCRMLLCKDFMSRAKVVVDPSKEFKLTDKKEIKKKKKKAKKEGE